MVVAIENLPPSAKTTVKEWIDKHGGIVTYLDAPFERVLLFLSAELPSRWIYVVFHWFWEEANHFISSDPLMRQTRWCPLGRVVRDVGIASIALRPDTESSKRNSATDFYFGLMDVPVVFYRSVDEIIDILSKPEQLRTLFTIQIPQAGGE